MKKYKLFALKNAKTKWVKIGVEGEWEGHNNGSFKTTTPIFEKMVENFEKSNVDLVVDYEHSTLNEPKAIASGWISRNPLGLKVENGELWAKIEWTKEAQKHIENKEYKYLSPVFIFDTTDRSTGQGIGATLHSVALTNTPFLEELGAIQNKHTQGKEMSKELEATVAEQKNIITNKDVLIQELKGKIAKLEEVAEEQKEATAKTEVATALNKGLITKNQEAWALKYALSDKEGFGEYIKNAIPATDFSGEQFANSTTPQKVEKIDMAKV